MKLSTKAALYSALIFPGLGHFLLKRYLSAGLLTSFAAVALVYLVTKAVEKALVIADKIVSGEVQPDIVLVLQMVSQQAKDQDAQSIEVVTLVLVVLWLLGIIDSYRVGRLIEEKLERI